MKPIAHGTPRGYSKQGCRECEPCREAWRIYKKRRKHARQQGQVGRADLVPGWRVQRRIRALQRLGYPVRAITLEAWGYPHPLTTDELNGSRSFTIGRFQRLDDVYQRWQATPGPSARVRNMAEQKLWAAPLDWDDIDDPDEVPYCQRPEVAPIVRRRLYSRKYEQTRRNRNAA